MTLVLTIKMQQHYIIKKMINIAINITSFVVEIRVGIAQT